MAAKLIILLLPALVYARINVEISGKYNGDDSAINIYYSGSEVGVISDSERNSFKLGDKNLKNGAKVYYGRRPDDAYLRSLTPWGDLYQSYDWDQVLTTLLPKSAKVLSVTSEPQIVMQQIFENNSTKPATFNVGISQRVQNTVSSSWSKSGELSLGQDIEFNFDIDSVNGGGKTALSYTSSYGTDDSKGQSITVGSSAEMAMLLQPAQSVMAELQANRGTIRIELEYEASLSGQVAVNYNEVYKGHHFWGLDVRAVMSSAGLTNSITAKEIVEIGFYSKSVVVVYDRDMKSKMLEVKF